MSEFLGLQSRHLDRHFESLDSELKGWKANKQEGLQSSWFLRKALKKPWGTYS